ncbi:MAG: carboxypeptidase-like regulatory domain-containing protein [Ignavibacteriales bacterium]|nr:carboxypeptidase-like regulatory domain-containing protein [Ignavibacteriales bacterium]
MKIFAAIFFLAVMINAQQFTIRGKVVDKTTNQAIPYSNIRVANTNYGTSSTIDGNFQIQLAKGNYKLIVSNIGYVSDTISIRLNENKNLTIELEPTPINLNEVTVFPGENPALEIIRRVIEAKHERNDKIESYVFRAYTKGIIKTTEYFNSSGSSVGIEVGSKSGDTSNLKITGIIENESKGYFKKPNLYKDEIVARKQSSNTPSSINIFTGGRLIQNFYSDDIRFFNRPLLSPIADEAIEYYDYFIEDTLAMDKHNVFKINFEPLKKINPGFVGTLYVEDKTYNLIKLEAGLNDPANPGRIFTSIKIIQQFTPHENNIVMPIDYRINVEGNPMGLFKFGFELNSIFFDYQINKELDKNIFDMTIIKVNPDADQKDSSYWKSVQTIPNSEEEIVAYKKIDSLETVQKSFWDNFSILATNIPINKNFSISGPLSIYSFNHIEGHTLNFGVNASQLFEKRMNLSLDLSYGFSDKKFKQEFFGNYYLGDYRTTNVSFRGFNKLTDLFSESIRYNKLTSTLTSLFGKYDFRNYFYTKGFSASVQSQVFPILNLGIGFLNRTDNNAYHNSDFSFFNKKKSYNINQSIYETRINAVTTSFQIDFRKFIEDGYFRRKINTEPGYIIFSGNLLFSNSSILKSKLDFSQYRITINGSVPLFASASSRFSLLGISSSNAVPFQMLYSLPGNIESASQTFTMRTLGTGEVFGDKSIYLSVENNLNDELFRLLGLKFLIDLQMNLSVHFNAAMITISNKSKNILPQNFINNSLIEFKKPFAEIGFGIGQQLFPLRIEFTWKLNYLGKNNFVIGINTPIL